LLFVCEKETEYAGHAQDFARDKVNLDDCHALVTVSGDGLLHEVIQGLMQRPDAAEAIRRVHLGVIPAGSGNGLAAALGALDPLAAAFNIAKGSNSLSLELSASFSLSSDNRKRGKNIWRSSY